MKKKDCMTDTTRITVVTVCFNCASEIAGTIESVISQDYGNMEYIVIDGNSSDGTVQILERYASSIDVLISEPDKGVYDAMNKALSLATGRWICFMNAGDRFSNRDTLSTMMAGDVSGLKVIYGNTRYHFRDGHTEMHDTADMAYLKKIFSMYQPYTHQAVIYDIEDKSDCRYDLRYRICSDYNTAIRYFRKYGPDSFRHVPVTVAEYKAFDGISSDVRELEKESIVIRIRNRMNAFCILKSMVRYLLRR